MHASPDWESYRVLLALSRTGTFRDAAVELGVSHATVSRRLARLQDSMGVALLEQRGRASVLTEAGEQVVAAAEAMEARALEVGRKLSGKDRELRGTVRVALPAGLLPVLAPSIAAFSHRYGGIVLHVSTGWSYASLVRREADVALRIAQDPHEILVGRRLAAFELAAFGSRDLLERLGPRSWSELPWIGWTAGSKLPMEQWRLGVIPDAPCPVQVDGEVSMYELIRSGVGVGYLPARLGDQSSALRRISPSPPVFTRPMWVLTHPDLRSVPRVKAVMRWIAEVLG